MHALLCIRPPMSGGESGMINTPVRVGMPLDDFLRQANQQPFDLIDGQRIAILPTVAIHGVVTQFLFLALYTWVSQRRLGEVFQQTTFILADHDDADWVTGSRTPDVLFYAGSRIADYESSTPNWQQRPYPLVPDLVIEVVSPTDLYSEVERKVAAYLADGVRLVVVVDPQLQRITVNLPDGVHHKLSSEATLDLSAVIDGCTLPLAEIFAPVR
jgi:Uma2 family endonuclease